MTAGLVLTLASFAGSREARRNRLELDFRGSAALQLQAIDGALAEGMEALWSVGVLYHALGALDRQVFHRFLDDEVVYDPQLRAIAWAPWIQGSQRPHHEASAREAGLVDYEIRELSPAGELLPAGPRGEHFPVLYVEPMEGNQTIVGGDLASDPRVQAALDRARESRGPQATGPIRLFQLDPGQPGFVMLSPVEDPADEGQLAGFAVGVFDIQALLGTSFIDMPSDKRIAFDVFDVTPGEPSSGALQLDADAVRDSGLSWSKPLDVAGRTWEFRFHPTAAYLAAHADVMPWMVLITGLLLTASVSGYLWMTLQRSAQVEALVAERTAKILEQGRRLERATEKAAQLETLRRVASRLAHEIRQPLAVVRNVAYLLDRRGGSGELSRYSELLREEAERLNAHVTALLEFTEPQPPRPDPVPLASLAAEALKLVPPPPEVLASVEVPPGALVTADRDQLRVAFANILANAYEAMPKGGRLAVCGRERDSCWEVEFGDSGSGISPSHLPHVFQPLFTTKTFGLGLGLTTAEQIVAAQGGGIRLESHEDAGTTVVVCLPKTRGNGSCPVLEASSIQALEKAAAR